jgi:hypothetical protein
MGGAILCPICGNNQAYCKCTRLEKEQFLEIARLREEMRRREALWTACADQMQLVYGSALRPKPLPPGPEGDA